MVCVQEVLLWFKDLNQSLRIEVICGLFDMCTPFELRFFWTLLETYGKRDSFEAMKDTQIKLCTESEILKLSNLTDTVIRSNLLISLILIESSNRRCASIIYNMIIEQLQTEKLTLMLHTDVKCVNDVVLMLTLASHHPAFSFQEQSVLSDKLLKLKETLLPAQDYEVYNNAVWSFSTLTPPPSNDLEILPVLAENSALAVNTNYVTEWPNDLSAPPAQIEPVRTQLSSLEICGIEKNRGFRLKALWSNGKSYEVVKSYPEIFNFHQKLLQSVAHATPIGTSELSVPHLPIDEGTNTSVPQMAEFFRQLSNNSVLLNNDSVLSFLSSKPVLPPLVTSQISTIDSNSYGPQSQFQQVTPPYLDGAIAQTSPPSNVNESRPSSRPSVLPSSSSPGPSPLSSPVSSPFVSPPASGTSSRSASPWQTQQQGFNTAYPPTSYHRNNPSVPRALRAKNSNPGNNCGSSSSSSSSGYGNGQGSRSNNSKVGSGDICLLEQLLTRERLRKYIDNLRPYRIHELQGMSQDELENVGLMKGAAGKLKKVLDSIGSNTMNGGNSFHHRNHHHHQCVQNHKAPVSSNNNSGSAMPATQMPAAYNFSPSSPGSESSSPPPSPPLIENSIQGQNSRTSSSDENLSAGATTLKTDSEKSPVSFVNTCGYSAANTTMTTHSYGNSAVNNYASVVATQISSRQTNGLPENQPPIVTTAPMMIHPFKPNSLPLQQCRSSVGNQFGGLTPILFDGRIPLQMSNTTVPPPGIPRPSHLNTNMPIQSNQERGGNLTMAQGMMAFTPVVSTGPCTSVPPPHSRNPAALRNNNTVTTVSSMHGNNHHRYTPPKAHLMDKNSPVILSSQASQQQSVNTHHQMPEVVPYMILTQPQPPIAASSAGGNIMPLPITNCLSNCNCTTSVSSSLGPLVSPSPIGGVSSAPANLQQQPANNGGTPVAVTLPYHSYMHLFPPLQFAGGVNNFISATLPHFSYLQGLSVSTIGASQNASHEMLYTAAPGFHLIAPPHPGTPNGGLNASSLPPPPCEVPPFPGICPFPQSNLKVASCYNCGLAGHRGPECKEEKNFGDDIVKNS